MTSMNEVDRDLLVRIDMNVASLVKAREDHEVRLRVLESTGQSHKGAIKIAVAVSSAIWGLILVGAEVLVGHLRHP